ncbi:hypothetical protein OGAPHI_005190 [Ogataea philodendri]|uniref:Uncharacterized protein n=1 Tax=Ogataea philodendri TaxID=1378263 RepID=A0A9P8P253_9ASCO|nr:uncharacterized protein OGAPHI_005190 [Ogataea philodendri]KAH3663787.1 hypothetical protein OGAPHI_005190 [Ogataea philodendri]
MDGNVEELLLEVVENLGHGLVSVEHRQAGFLVPCQKLFINVGGELLSGNHQSTKSFSGHVSCLFLEPVVLLNDLGHHRIGAFFQEPQLFAGLVANNNSHSLRLRAKREHLQDVIVKRLVGSFVQCGQTSTIPFHQRQTDALCIFNNGNFVWRCSLVAQLAVFVGWCHVVADGQSVDKVSDPGTQVSSRSLNVLIAVADVFGHQIHAVSGIRNSSKMQFLKFHVVLGQGSCFIAQQAYTDLPRSRFTRKDTGMIVENRIKNRITSTYQSLVNPWHATNTKERMKTHAQRILERLLISSSKSPVLTPGTEVFIDCRVSLPV